ncbi:hypothetical protein [Paracoccus aerius]|uniref:Uncharacterized protein n=2 Tax=Paracoccus aerius TaxID=1915382 RepID=A0ABS1SDC2_9RHOB|nr:hypothetical protein [Paracoccus aerius]MBL3675697.1 hypothetical protein [Paracoccus aerius]
MSTAFFAFLRRAPQGVQNCFDVESRKLDTDALERYLGFASSGEAVLARFFASVWCRSNDDFDFDVLDVGRLDYEQRQIISDWVLNPIWP